MNSSTWPGCWLGCYRLFEHTSPIEPMIKNRVISNNNSQFWKRALADVSCHCKNDAVMALDGVTSFLRLKDIKNACKHLRNSLTFCGISSLHWRKVGRSWRLQICFHHLLWVRIEIDQLKCVSCCVIIHCLSVSCKKINHSHCALVIWSSYLQTVIYYTTIHC